MRKSTLKSRLLSAGFTTGALVAALLVSPQPASAALTATAVISPPSGPAAGTITATKAGFMTGLTTTGANFTTSDTCTSTFTSTPSGNNVAAAVATRVTDNTATVPVPTILTPPVGTTKQYTLCIYSNNTNGVGTLIGDAYYTVGLAVTPSSGPATGSLTVALPGFLAGVATATTGALITTTTPCPTTYGAVTASATQNVATATKVSDDKATIPLPAGLTLNSGLARQFSVCVFANATTGGLVGEGTYTIAPVTTLSPATGASGGGGTLTVTAPTGTVLPSTLTGYVAISSCPVLLPSTTSSAYQATVTRNAAGSAATFTAPAGVAGAGSTATPYVACLYGGTTAGTSALVSTSSVNTYSVTLPKVDLSSSTGGPNTGSFFASSTTNFLTTAPNPGGIFTAGERCPATYSTATVNGVVNTAASVRRLANNRAGVTVPTSGVGIVNSLPTPYQVCIYSDATATGKLLGNPTYTVAAVPTVTSVFPDAGPSQGGATITIYGSNLPTAANSITATLGGSPLNVTPVTDTYFTAVTPLHAVDNDVSLIVTTSVGTSTLPAAYDFANSITVTPNTASNVNPTVDLDVTGVGFLSLAFAAFAATVPVSTTTTSAHVYLVNGVYDPASVTGDGAAPKGNGPVAECSNVQVVTDNELFCTLQLNQRRNAAGTFVLPAARTAVADVTTTAGSPIITSPTAAFTSADVGVAIKGTANDNTVPAGTTIVSVTSPTTAVLSANALLTAAGNASVDIGGVARAVLSGVTTTNGSTTITKASSFTSADIGRVVTTGSNTPVALGTTIVAVAADGGSATLSKPAIADGAANVAVSFFAPSPVPNGAYNVTIVSNGAIDAARNVPTYSQSIVSSGSMFSVAPF